MTVAADMLKTSSVEIGYDADALVACIDTCFECAQACTACADACLGEQMVAEMRRCITSDLNCADVCAATGRLLSRQAAYDSKITRAALEACRDICRACAAESEKHASMHEHCRVCGETCRRCEKACDALLAS